MTAHYYSRLLPGALLATTLALSPLPTQAQSPVTIPVGELPTFSSAGIGQGREPVSFIYIGTERQIINLFISHGFSGADPLTPATLLQAYEAAKADAPYPTAPFSPAIIQGHRQDLEFQLPTSANSIRERHHTRIWDTTVQASDGRQVWVGTASFDDGLQALGRTSLPVHHIDPNLDGEREFILDTLGFSGLPYVQLNSGGSGQNSFGNPYYTDGRAVIVDLGSPDTTPAAVHKDSSPSLSTRVSSWIQQAASHIWL